MKVLIASTIVPFVDGGGSFIVDWLEESMRRYGHQVDCLRIPFHSDWRKMMEQMLALRLMDVEQSGDLLVTIRTPSYLLKHPNKIVWFIHHHRPAYDLWNTSYRDLPETEEGLLMRQAIMDSDNRSLREAKHLFTNSKIVSDRLKHFNKLDSEVLYPPLMDPERFRCDEYGDYVFYPSRIVDHKRQLLAVQAMRYTKSQVKLVLAGAPGEQDQLENLNRAIEENDLKDKVRILAHWISEEEKIELYSKALCGLYIPYLEDSYGYPSLEAHHAKKAVITCNDSGGTLELIDHGHNGLIAAPTPESLAECMDQMFLDKAKARAMGEAGIKRLDALGVNWDHIIGRMTQ